jgi:hypothetical protein
MEDGLNWNLTSSENAFNHTNTDKKLIKIPVPTKGKLLNEKTARKMIISWKTTFLRVSSVSIIFYGTVLLKFMTEGTGTLCSLTNVG